jgi:hypothetical protein
VSRRLPAALALAAAALAVLTAPANAQDWLPDVRLGGAVLNLPTPQVFATPDFAASWDSVGESLLVEHGPGPEWAEPLRSPGTIVASSPAGDLLAVGKTASGINTILSTSVRRAGSDEWSTGTRVVSNGVYNVKGAINERGEAFVVWRTSTSSTHTYGSMRSQDGTWTDTSFSPLIGYDVGIDASGGLLLVGSRETYNSLYVYERFPGAGQFDVDSWSSANISYAAMNGAGEAVVAWAGSDGALARTRNASGEWSDSVPLDATPSAPLAAALDTAGNAYVTLSHGGTLDVVARPAGEAWGSPQRLGGYDGGPPGDSALAVGPAGDVAVAWPQPPDYAIVVRRRPRDAVSWTSAAPISWRASMNSPAPTLAIDAAGDLAVGWLTKTTGSFREPRVSLFDATPPTLHVTASASSGHVGDTVTFHADASDLLSDAVSLNWKFSDGTDVAGADASRSLDAPGVLHAVATARDAVGNTATRAFDVSVAAVPAPTPTPTPDAPPSAPQPEQRPTDTSPPALTVATRASWKSGELRLVLSTGEPCTISASGTLAFGSRRFALKPARTGAAGRIALRLRLGRSDAGAVTRLLRHRHGVVKLKLVAVDAAGNRTSLQRTAKL